MNQTSQWKPAVKRVSTGERERLKKGKVLLRQKRYDEALVEFNAILENNPHSINALLGIGLICMRQEQFDEALAWLERAKSLDPLQPKPYLLEGAILSRQENMEGAEQAFRAALALDPRLQRALLGLGEILLSKQRYGEALAQFREVLRYNPQQTAARLLVAKIHMEQNKIDEAIREIQTVLEIDPKQIKAYLKLARLYATCGDQEKVLSTLDLALTKLPKDNSLAYLKLGRLASDLKCYEVAEKAFREVLGLYPKRMIAQLYLVESLIGADKLEEAEACLKKLPMNNEFSALVHKLMGDIYHQRKQFRMAVEEYRATILSIPELAQEHASLIEEADNDQNDDWESLAETYQPSLTNTVTEQAERMRGNRARRRDQ